MRQVPRPEIMLAFDTCGEQASLVLLQDGAPLAEALLEQRTASAALLGAVRDLLQQTGVTLPELTSVGLVNGPGSFTGIRVGLAVAKGLCESCSLPLALASRLAVLAHRGQAPAAVCALRAGRQELYVRQETGTGAVNEELVSLEAFRAAVPSQTPVICAEEEVLFWLAEDYRCQKVCLSALAAWPLLQASLQAPGVTAALADAHYVRQETSIYTRAHSLSDGPQLT